ncbi:hypothetical protein SAY87_012946 [Trapa incisa]|uniref:non-specific serine/threonine protein kinase n=1 Tax=Trapa incisa TaxID=236973 RepID=A0AAN7KFK5_9MYRT|nr:hypothetical protein SAY87_012946 [Trapa incisa]
MKLQRRVAFNFLVGLFLIQPILCGEISETSGTNKWACLCSLKQGNGNSILESNCSSSCNCSAVKGSNGGWWSCKCGDNGFPRIASQIQDTACFSSCNCTSGALNGIPISGKNQSSKIVVVTLLLCAILTTIAFLSSIMCYLHRKKSFSIEAPAFSSEKEASCDSANLVDSVTSSVLKTKSSISPHSSPFTACFQKAYILFQSKSETIHGTICQFPYVELEYATNNFSNANLVGLGGSSYVYRGQLKNGRIVAIKWLKDHGGPDSDSMFLTEVELLARLNHCHVVPLLGYCSELQGKQVGRLLVFEYVPNGNLRDCLDGELGENINWETRVTIAIGAARGLEYLHEAAAPRILHRDVKSTNILLDANWGAKITDLGMAKCLKPDGLASCSSSPATMQGTFGYFAPEYAIIGRASLKSDVFSFGVVLLELITGRQPIQKSTIKGEESLVIWATPRLKDSRRVISELPDPRLKGNFPEEEMQIMAYLAKECLLLDPESRPTMSEVVQILSTIAPNKSRARNIHADLFQFTSSNISRAETNLGVLEKQVQIPVDADELLKVGSQKWPPPSSLPSENNRKCTSEIMDITEGKDISSKKQIEPLILLPSKAKGTSSWWSREDDMVDLVEPRLESFCLENSKFP